MSARSAIKHVVTTTAQQPTASTQRFLNFSFNPHAGPVNATTHSQTHLILKDPSHPHHIQAKRRVAAFDPRVLHWAVKVPVALSKKAVVRKWATRRVREAFLAELQARGYEKDGSRNSEDGDRRSLKGVLAIYLDRGPGVIRADGKEVRRQAAWVLDRVVQKFWETGDYNRLAGTSGKRFGKGRSMHQSTIQPGVAPAPRQQRSGVDDTRTASYLPIKPR